MAKYQFDNRKPSRTNRGAHPAWRGIGCLLLLIIPVFSYALATVLVPVLSQYWPIPNSLAGYPTLPAIIWRFQITTTMFGWITSIYNLWINLLLAAVIMALLFGLVAAVYAILYQAAAPSRYGPYDVPPPRVKTKKYKR